MGGKAEVFQTESFQMEKERGVVANLPSLAFLLYWGLDSNFSCLLSYRNFSAVACATYFLLCSIISFSLHFLWSARLVLVQVQCIYLCALFLKAYSAVLIYTVVISYLA